MTLTTTIHPKPKPEASSGLILTGDRPSCEAQRSCVPGDILDPDGQQHADNQPSRAVGVDTSAGGQSLSDSHSGLAPGDILDPVGRGLVDAQQPSAVRVDTSARGQTTPDSGPCRAPGISCPSDPTNEATPPEWVTSDGWAALRLLAEMYEDAQRSRIGCENRVRSATVDPDLTAASLDALARAEHELKKALQAQYKRTVPAPIQAWAKETRGIGKTSPHMLARLLGVIGHPVIATPHRWEGEGSVRVLVADPPFARNVAKLWAYCGHGDPNRKRAKGMTAPEAARLGNPRAKMLTHLLAEAVIKSANPDYRIVYDTRRETTAVTHPDWSKGHSHNDALHLVGKEILRDLWTAARQE